MDQNYVLPIVVSLKEIGFKFEFNTIKDVFTYTKKFVKKNKDELIEVFFPGLDADEYEYHQSYRNCDKDDYVLEIVKTKLRLATGKIRKQDYMWKVPPWLKDNKKVLIQAYQNQLEKYMIDSRLAFYDQTYLSISRKKAFRLVLYNETLRSIIESISPNPFGDYIQDENEEVLEDLRFKINRLKEKGKKYFKSGRELLGKACYHSATLLEYEQYELFFLIKQTVHKKAIKTYNNIPSAGNIDIYPKYTSIQDKENVVTQYLKLQTPKVRASKNTRGKGINANKRQLVLSYSSQNPDASQSEIAQECNVDRKTVRRYLNV